MYLAHRNKKKESLNIETNFFAPSGGKNISAKDYLLFAYLKKSLRHHCHQNGIQRISTSSLEQTALFEKTLGTNFVKDNFLQVTKSEDPTETTSFAINGTLPNLRNYIENKIYDQPQPVEFYYFEHFFSKKNNKIIQKYLFGIDILGEKDPVLDVQIINILIKTLTDIKIINETELQITCVGCPTCQNNYEKVLLNYYTGKERVLCEQCKKNLKNNISSLLTCPEEDCQILAANVPLKKDYLCSECRKFYQLFKEYLTVLNIAFVEKDNLVGEFNYLNPIVYQIIDTTSKKNNVLAHGGRYNWLMKKISTLEKSGNGLYLDIEKVIRKMKKIKLEPKNEDYLHVFVAQLGIPAKKEALKIMDNLRANGIKVIGALGKWSLRQQLELAGKLNVRAIIIIWEMEVLEQICIIRNVLLGDQEKVPLEQAVKVIKNIIGEHNLNNKWKLE